MKKAWIKMFLVLVGTVLFISCKSNNNVAGNNNPIFKDSALKGITDEINSNPKDAHLYYQRGEILHKMQIDTLALDDFKKAASLDSSKAEYFSSIGDLLFDHKDITGSLPWLQKAMALNPKDEKTHLKIANMFVYTKDYTKALSEINEVLRQDVYSGEAYFLKGLVYKDMKDTSKAISSFLTALQMQPKYKNAMAELGELYSAQKNPIALSYFDKLYSLDSLDAFPLYARGMFYQNQNDYQQAKAEYKNCIIHEPQYGEAYFAIGWILMQQDSFQKAWNQYDLVTKIEPNNAGAYYNRGLCSELLKKKDDAVSDYKQALVFKPDYAEAKEGIKRLGGK